MSTYKYPLTPLEESGLRRHGLARGTPSQLSDCFRLGMRWAIANQKAMDEQRQRGTWDFQLGAADAMRLAANWVTDVFSYHMPNHARLTAGAMRRTALSLKALALINQDRALVNDPRGRLVI